MMRSHRFDPLIRRAEERESQQAGKLAESSAALGDQEQRLSDLRRYADEYGGVAPGAALTPALLANRNAFRERIADALVQQQKAVDSSRRRCDVERARLMLASRETRTMEQLASSYRTAEARVQARRSQTELDDLAARAFVMRQQGGDGE